MAGSIRERPDKGADAFELRVFLGRDAGGRVRHKSRLFRGTRRAAELELARMVAAQDRTPAMVPDETARMWGQTTTINDAIYGWKINGWADLSPSTTRRYHSIWKTHIEGSIGRRKIASLGPYDVELYLRGLKATGLSEATVRQIRAVLHRACRLARKWSRNELPNPVADTELPDWALSDQPDPVRCPSIEEVRAIIGAARERDFRIHGFVCLVAATGIRRGEACALRWENVDLSDSPSVTIDEAVVAVHGGTEVKGPKSRSGVRKISLDRATAEGLRRIRSEVEHLGVIGGFHCEPAHFVFATELPGIVPPHPDTMSHAFAAIRDAAGVRADVHLHSLRHFHATAIDAVVSEAQKQSRLGWATVAMARHYTDRVDEEDRRAAEHVGRLLSGGESGPPQLSQRLVLAATEDPTVAAST